MCEKSNCVELVYVVCESFCVCVCGICIYYYPVADACVCGVCEFVYVCVVYVFIVTRLEAVAYVSERVKLIILFRS